MSCKCIGLELVVDTVNSGAAAQKQEKLAWCMGIVGGLGDVDLERSMEGVGWEGLLMTYIDVA